MRISKFLFPAFLLLLSLTVQARKNHILVKASDAQSLLDAIEQANRENADSLSPRLFILIPNGTYDLGEKALTTLTGHNVAIIGQSMRGTVIVNRPPVEKEGIQTTATLKLVTTDAYLQDLTLKNELDYYHAGSSGRAVCLQDKGVRTICKNVCMLSHQDTFYSDNLEAQTYMEGSEIHGTVDFICGSGDVYFNHCTIVTERRNPDGSGRNVIAAPRTASTPWGYVFEGCHVYNRMSTFHYARGWHTAPRCTWLNTTLMQPGLLRKERFDPQGMRAVNNDFHEYGTKDADGHDITPKSNVVTFVCKGDSNSVETILTDKEARRFQLRNVFPKWRPERIVARMERSVARLKRTYLN